ncbi:MAG: ABC transporter permease [Turicibacter sp.]|nr:ABC transporter permease [Turicibacter sp.]
MKRETKGSPGYINYLKGIKRQSRLIHLFQFLFCVAFLIIWEVLANYGIIDTFFFSKPSAIWTLLIKYIQTGELFTHVGTSLYETMIGLIAGTLGGLFISICLWWSERLAKFFDPFLVILNALPKTALAPILIVWVGTNAKGIISIAIITSITVTIMSAYNYFATVDPEKIRLMKSFGANKWQILTKLILPANSINIINLLKINIGMTWVGVIVGEFVASRAGIGYLIVYGGQVFKLSLVMMGVFVLAILTLIMYEVVNLIENYLRKKQSSKK